jgi:hypothetical protein
MVLTTVLVLKENEKNRSVVETLMLGSNLIPLGCQAAALVIRLLQTASVRSRMEL